MAAVAVAADNSRYDAMDSTANTNNIGGGAGEGVETDIVYQGTASISRKVTNGGFLTDTGAARDLTATARLTWLVKVWLTNYGSLSTTGNILEVRVGSGTAAYYAYTVGSPTVEYPGRGGWVVLAIDPNVASHRDGTTGSPVLTAADYFAAFATCSTSKAENLCLDAIDVGYGLYLTGGDGADADGDFDDFIADDEGDTTNGRFGYVTTQEGIPFVLGRLVIGATTASGARTAVATEFTDVGTTVVFPDNKAAAGFSGFVFDLANASTIVSLDRSAFASRGTEAGEDTRAVFAVFGTSGSMTLDGVSITSFATIDFTSGVTADSCVVASSGPIDLGGASLSNSQISASTVATGVAAVVTDDLELISSCSFTSGAAGHAIELTATGTYNFDGNLFSGYGADATNNAAIYNNSGGAVTINITGGGDTPTVRNGTSATTTVNSGVTTTITVLDDVGVVLQDARVYVTAASGGPLTLGTVIISGLTNASGDISDTRVLASDQPVTGWVRKGSAAPFFKQGDIAGTIDSASGLTVTVQMVSDE